ncbi:MFS transporter [Bacillus sp. LL01]|uniref:MFS transporter n=1 Tax=Bacillus sp. LL01 TaxID=1665556 RepID=UPI00064D2806|nr:MFS transporter [Bacillus sp. LL01]KMJ59482.1 MFS transporter [Bacillus sp. LL01]
MRLKWIIVSQSVVLFGTGLVFPFYIIFLREAGGNFTDFGIAYGLFTLSAALVHRWIGKVSDKKGRKVFLLINAWGTSVLFLLFPMVNAIWQVFSLQIILGVIGAMQKTSEKALLADMTDIRQRGKQIGEYHFWVSIFSGFAVIVSGFLIDLFTVDFIFYLGSIILFVSGWMVMRIDDQPSVETMYE